MAVRPAAHRPRQIVARVPCARRLLDRRAAGKAQLQHLGGLVEGLPQGIVQGRAEPAVAPDAFDHQELAMAARDQQQEIGEGHGVGQPRGQRMGLQVVDRQQRQPVDRSDGARRGQAYDQAADQARAGGRRDRRQLREGEPGLGHDPRDQPIEDLDMGARGDLGHHAAERRVLLELAVERFGQHRPVATHQGHGGLVAAGLDPEHHRAMIHASAIPVGAASFPPAPGRPHETRVGGGSGASEQPRARDHDGSR